MSVEDYELLELAKQIESEAKGEAAYRNSVSRSYYAIYHKASNFHDALPSKGEEGKRGGVHARFISRLNNPTVICEITIKKSKMAGYVCQDMRTRRVDADYKLDKNIKKGEAEYGILVASDFFEKIDS